MSRWLKVTEGLFRGRVNDQTPFEVHCACGRTVTGVRTKAAQTQNCPVCQTRLFVLPVSVYPQPRSPQRQLNKAAPKSVSDRVADLADADPDEPASGRTRPTNPQAVKTRSGARADSAKTTRAPVDVEPTPPADPSSHRESPFTPGAGVDLARLRRKLLSPVRIVLAGVALVVGLLAVWGWHLSALRQADRTVVTAVKQAESALKERNIEAAARQFREVRLALDVLGRSDSRAQALRQTSFELTAAADLAHASLFEILHEASTVDRDSWPAKFRTNYRDEWVVIDALVAPVDDSAVGDTPKGYRYDIDFHLADGPNQAVIIADLPAFDQVIPKRSEPLRVIFAAQLDDCYADTRRENTWRIVLRPTTGFLWSNPEHLGLLGVEADDETKQLLAEQTTRLGISP